MTSLLPERAPSAGPRSTGAVGITRAPRLGGTRTETGSSERWTGCRHWAEGLVGRRSLHWPLAARLGRFDMRSNRPSNSARHLQEQDVPVSAGRREHKAPCPSPPASPPQWVLKWLCGRGSGFAEENARPQQDLVRRAQWESRERPRLGRRGNSRSESGIGEQLQNMLRRMFVNFSVTGDGLGNFGRGVVIPIVLSTVTNKHATS